MPGVTAMLGYEETELDPAIQAEILYESSRTEARIAILEILVALAFGVWYQLQGPFRAVALFALVTVIPLLVDASLRRKAASRLQGVGPQPAAPPGAPR